MGRVAFLVDGFNLYHSLKDASLHLGLLGRGTRWLDLRAFCASYLHVIGGGAQLAAVHYFSALASHMEAVQPEVTKRHLAYIACLRATGVEVELSHFKQKWLTCPFCRQRIARHEEKETDVAIGAKLIELLTEDRCDDVVLLSGDSDISPAVRLALRLFPEKRIFCCFPYNRQSLELRCLVRKSFKVSKERYRRFQFPDLIQLADGRRISKPPQW